MTQQKVAILTAEGFEEVELTRPMEALQAAGYAVDILAPVDGPIKSWKSTDWGKNFDVTYNVNRRAIQVDDYVGLLLPGGVINPDKLRTCKNSMEIIQEFDAKQKPIAAICHGPQSLIEAGVVSERKVTSFPSIRTDLENAGGDWFDEEVVIDRNLVTSRNPDDIPAFNHAFIRLLKATS